MEGNRDVWHTIWHMRRTTVYFPDEMKTAIEREAASRGVTEAEVIRSAVASHVGNIDTPERRFPLFDEPLGADIAGRIDDLLEGFGEQS
jgi:hypothetical protein